MKSYFILLLFPLILCILSCSDTSLIEVPVNVQSGGLFLKIDKTTAPNNVVEVVALLTREGYDSLSGNMNLLSGTNAEITFQNVPVGPWHLKVDALNDSGTVVYTGETNLSILEGIVIQVTLTLMPTGNGTGGVYILVNWGLPPVQGWIDYIRNPIFSNQQSPLNPVGISMPKILFENGKYKMWFINVFNSAVGSIGYAESNDGINWNYVHSSAVLTHGPVGSWDSYSVGINAVIKDGNEYKMYYSGFQNQNEMWHIGLATSPDGINWTKRTLPVLYATNNEIQIVASDVVKVDSIYYMYYSVISNNQRGIYLATSIDGINWNRYQQNPILMATKPWENSGVYFPTVIYENANFKMVYSNLSADGFGMALSVDGKNWVKNENNPFFTAIQSINNWTTEIAYPHFKKIGNEYRIYYTGTSSSMKIGLVRKLN